tara:strand:- start:91 stop:912 length:822 start_codon:yes stop_codon:yes gene_type:complete
MQNVNRFNSPMQPMAENLASRGRYGDSMLVHMNPIEVESLASLSPTGSLTTNPDTGQPEAFLPLLLGLAGSGLGGAGMLGGLGALSAGAIGSGLGTFFETGDLGEGIKSGLMGALMGKVSGELLKGLGGTAAKAGGSAVTGGAKGVNYMGPSQAGFFEKIGANAGIDPTGKLSGFAGGLDKTLANSMDPTKGIISTGLVPGMTAAGMSWEPDPMGSMTEDDEDDWGEGILKDRGFQAAPQGYSPGVDPEWDYYRNPFDVDVRPRQFKHGGLVG